MTLKQEAKDELLLAANAEFVDLELIVTCAKTLATTNYQNVKDFNKKIGRTVPDAPMVPDQKTLDRAFDLVIEEIIELQEAIEARDLTQIAKESADVKYVVNSLMAQCGVDMDAVDEAVHLSNMAKLGGPKRGDGKQLKPEGWKAPDIEACLT